MQWELFSNSAEIFGLQKNIDSPPRGSAAIPYGFRFPTSIHDDRMMDR